MRRPTASRDVLIGLPLAGQPFRREEPRLISGDGHVAADCDRPVVMDGELHLIALADVQRTPRGPPGNPSMVTPCKSEESAAYEEFTLFLPASSVPRRPRGRSPRELSATRTPKGWFLGELYTRPRRTREEGRPRR